MVSLFLLVTILHGTGIGGEEDEHGCLTSAGYGWCPKLKQCIRPWEMECPSKEKYGTGFQLPTEQKYEVTKPEETLFLIKNKDTIREILT